MRPRNMRAGTYDLVALQDLNGNYVVDEFEEVAFTETGIEVQGDSLQAPAKLYAFAQPGFEQRIRDYRTDSSGYFALHQPNLSVSLLQLKIHLKPAQEGRSLRAAKRSTELSGSICPQRRKLHLKPCLTIFQAICSPKRTFTSVGFSFSQF